MYTGQRHRSVLINSAMYTNRATLVFSRANHVAKAVSFFFFFCLRSELHDCDEVLWQE